jgi:hypothetical protein
MDVINYNFNELKIKPKNKLLWKKYF